MRVELLLKSALVALVALLFAAGCKVTAEDIEEWKGTVKGPGKIVAVMLSDHYDIELRTRAALALVEMEPRSSPERLDPVAELQRAIQSLDDETRTSIISGMVPGLLELMRGADSASSESDVIPPMQIRAKDASFLMLEHAEGEPKTNLTQGVVSWYTEDFNRRSLAGNYSAEQIIRRLGEPAAEMLVDALSPQDPPGATVKLAELIGALGTEETKARAGARLVEIEQHMEGEEFATWIREAVQAQARAQDIDLPEERLNLAVETNRDARINDGALPAMKHLAAQEAVSERLLVIAEGNGSEDRRRRALQALEGNAQEPQLERLLRLALESESPVGVRDYAFDRVGDIGSAEAIPPMWPLVANGEDEGQRLRWRAGEMVLAIGGSAVVDEFLRKLPEGEEVKYEPEELEGYATRLAQMTPAPTDRMRRELGSTNWWNRVIALRYFERKGTESDIAQMQRLATDDTAVVGDAWERIEITTVGKTAEAAITALRARLSGDSEESTEEEEEAEEEAEEGSE